MKTVSDKTTRKWFLFYSIFETNPGLENEIKLKMKNIKFLF